MSGILSVGMQDFLHCCKPEMRKIRYLHCGQRRNAFRCPLFGVLQWQNVFPSVTAADAFMQSVNKNACNCARLQKYRNPINLIRSMRRMHRASPS